MKTLTMLPFSSLLRSQVLYLSTVSSVDGARKANLLVDYLITSLQFSKQDAISTCSKSKVIHLRSTTNSDSVVNVFKNYGLDMSQIRDIVSFYPKILTCKANKTLEPKIRVFQERGFTPSDLVNLIKYKREIFRIGLHTGIMPALDFLRKLVGSDEKVIQVINKTRWMFLGNYHIKTLSDNVRVLRDYGLSDERISKAFVHGFANFMVKPELLRQKLDYVEQKLGISRESGSFIYGLLPVLLYTDTEIEKKMEVFKSFGWSDFEISLLLKAQPSSLNKSDANLREKLKFFMNDLGFTPSYMTTYNYFFTCSLEKRVKPRNMILNILKEKKLVKDKLPLAQLLKHTEVKFLDFLRGFERDIPCLRETYMNSLQGISKAK